MIRHTPGEWKVTRKFEVGPVSTADDQSFGMVTPVADVFGDNREADARLIAAAPELLEAVIATRKLVAEAALTGFNYADGDWAERLFANQAVLSAAIPKAEALNARERT